MVSFYQKKRFIEILKSVKYPSQKKTPFTGLYPVKGAMLLKVYAKKLNCNTKKLKVYAKKQRPTALGPECAPILGLTTFITSSGVPRFSSSNLFFISSATNSASSMQSP